MLSSHDIQSIEKDVHDVIMDWSTTIQIWDLKPISEQQYNPLMKEIIGEPQYSKQVNIPAKKRGVPDYELETNVGGHKYIGRVILSVPISHNGTDITINEDSIIILDSNTSIHWNITSLKSNIGEHILHIGRLVGDIHG